jgi:hypothetical protein
MPSSLTIYRAPFLPGNDAGNITAETQLPNGRGASLILALPSNGSLSNKSFRVRLAGRVQTNSNLNVTIAVYFGFSATIASNTQVFTTSAVTVNNLTTGWEIWLDCFWSGDGNLITGAGRGQVANSVIGPSALVNTPLSANPNRDSSTTLASGTTYGLTVTGLFSGSSTGNHLFVDDFSLEGV